MNEKTKITTWCIEVGQVADQSFAGRPYDPESEPKLYIGEGNYTEILGD